MSCDIHFCPCVGLKDDTKHLQEEKEVRERERERKRRKSDIIMNDFVQGLEKELVILNQKSNQAKSKVNTMLRNVV